MVGHVPGPRPLGPKVQAQRRPTQPHVEVQLSLAALSVRNVLRPNILLAPAVVGLIGHADLLARLPYRGAVCQLHSRLSELLDGLLRRVSPLLMHNGAVRWLPTPSSASIGPQHVYESDTTGIYGARVGVCRAAASSDPWNLARRTEHSTRRPPLAVTTIILDTASSGNANRSLPSWSSLGCKSSMPP